MDEELYTHAQEALAESYRRTMKKLSERKSAGDYTEEQYYDLNMLAIDTIEKAVYGRNARERTALIKKGVGPYTLKKSLWTIFDFENADTIKHLESSLQNKADEFCDSKKIQRVKVYLPFTEKSSLMSEMNRVDRKIEIARNWLSGYERATLEEGLVHELRHWNIYSKFGPSKYLISELHLLLSLGLCIGGAVANNNLIYTSGSALWSIFWFGEAYANLPRKKSFAFSMINSTIPWLIRPILNL